MDPAETEHLQNAISSQGIMLGNHEQTLCEVMEALRGLIASATHLGNRLDQVCTQLSATTSGASPSPPQATNHSSRCSSFLSRTIHPHTS